MKPYQRVALRYASEMVFKFNEHPRNPKVYVYRGERLIGNIGGRVEKVKLDEIEPEFIGDTYLCSDDMYKLIDRYPKLVKGDKVYVVSIKSSKIAKSVRGKGYGVEMYLKFLEHTYSMIQTPFLFIPNYCESVQDETSDSALRVWKSLSRKYPSSGDVIVYDGSTR